MSGGALDYIYSRVEEAAVVVRKEARTPLHRAFADHLVKVAKALHDMDWMLSGDYGEGDEIAAINACLSSDAALQETVRAAREALAELQAELAKVA